MIVYKRNRSITSSLICEYGFIMSMCLMGIKYVMQYLKKNVYNLNLETRLSLFLRSLVICTPVIYSGRLNGVCVLFFFLRGHNILFCICLFNFSLPWRGDLDAVTIK